MLMPTPPLPGTTIDPRFPDEDGRPMGDTDFHNEALVLLKQALEDFLSSGGWYVASNLIFYWDYADPHQRRDPDILVARGVGSHRRRSYRLWEEGTLPCVLMEVVSRKTWRVDIGPKREQYERLGIPEYFIFDPEGRYIHPPLQGFRLRKGAYAPIKRAADGCLTSQQLGLALRIEEAMLRLIDRKTGQLVLTRREQAEQLARRAEQAEREAQRVEKLAAEVERLRAELRRQKRIRKDEG
jgi:Uma2 family endonuclease